MVGNHSPLRNSKLLSDGGRLVIVGGTKGNWIAPFLGAIEAAITNPFVDPQLQSFTAVVRPEDLATLAEMVAAGTLIPQLDRNYPLPEAAEAMRYQETRRARGKVIIKPWQGASGSAADQL
jgi:NADPH:quinone reductase-like Zn-dependent oxidoreductase